MSWDFSNDVVSSGIVEPGVHILTIEEAEAKDTKAGDGEYINVKFITETNQALYQMFNIKNKNKKAQDIGRGQLKFILLANGRPDKLHDVNDLIGLRVKANVYHKQDDAYGPKPTIKSFSKLE